MAELAVILAVALLATGAFVAGAAWGRHRTRASLGAELEIRARAEREAQAASRAKSEILARVSHEVRTPINGVLGMAGLLLTADLPAARREKALQAVHSAAEVLLVLIDDLLDFSRIDAGKLVLRSMDFRLRYLLRRSVDLLEPQAADKGLELRFEVADELPDDLHGDPARLRQVLLNLIGNAVKFTREGEVRVRVEPEGPADRRLLRFSVRDTGIGISPKDQERIFAPFARAESTAAREIGGTGLGLVITKNLVELMGGEIGFESTREVGSTFWFRLPLTPSREPASLYETPVPASRPSLPVEPDAPRILVVDDNAINRLVAEAHLEVLGFRTEATASGSRALELLARQRFDAVLLDCQMPNLDGYETTRRLRRREKGGSRHTVVIGLTANVAPGSRELAVDAGMDDFLAKPLRAEELAAMLERTLPPAKQPAPEPASHTEPCPRATLRRLERQTGRDLLAMTAKAFRRESRQDLETIRRALAEGDADALAESAHSLGGSSDVLGAVTLAALCGELEDLARAGDLAACDAKLNALEGEFSRVASELDASR